MTLPGKPALRHRPCRKRLQDLPEDFFREWFEEKPKESKKQQQAASARSKEPQGGSSAKTFLGVDAMHYDIVFSSLR